MLIHADYKIGTIYQDIVLVWIQMVVVMQCLGKFIHVPSLLMYR